VHFSDTKLSAKQKPISQFSRYPLSDKEGSGKLIFEE